MKHKKRFFILLISALGIMLGGCWSYSEIDERLIVGTVGIDYIASEGMYRVTIRAVNAKPSDGGIDLVPEVLTTEGKSVFDAIRKASPLYARKTYWSHLQSIVLSDEVAEEDIVKPIDFFFRDAELRQDNRLYISSGCSAEEVVRLEAELQKKRQFTLRYAVRTQEFEASYPERELVEFGLMELDETIEPIVPMVTISKEEGEDVLKLEGAAVFLNRRMIGKLSRQESFITLMLINEIKNPLLVIPLNDKKSIKESKIVTVEIFNSKTKVDSSVNSGNINISISVALDASVGEINYPMNYMDENSIKELKNTLELNLKDQILKTVKIVQNNYKSDIFGFGKSVEINDPKLWNKIKNDWPEKFSQVSVDAHVTVNIDSTGKLLRTD
jgi:spore germination protein KC